MVTEIKRKIRDNLGTEENLYSYNVALAKAQYYLQQGKMVPGEKLY